ncbi:MAG: YebC/PmpR family DNA-binding transcriptional regulator, partial [Candidatus Hydrogenedentes bacterium]|nr:YebC/PmpR family DNA-binding transcriptional regulator [Candidatus Hydrogenedentota bacterium]
MAENGAVSWNFERKGVITVPKEGLTDDVIFEKAVEAGAEDVDTEGDMYEITTEAADLHAVSEALEEMNIATDNAELTMIPKTTVKVEGSSVGQVLRLMETLEDHDDVQNVYANFDISEEEMAAAVE